MDETLPVERSLPEVRQALAERGTAVLVAPPGSGKTTVVPLRLLAEPWLGDRAILVLEPRRLATRAAARRMAHLLGEEVGDTVGYTTRDDRRVGPRTRIEVVTEGVLTRRLQRSPQLDRVGLIIFDEFHERNLQTDLGLALTLDVGASLRPDLRVLVMSATVDAGRVAALLGSRHNPAPVVTSEARSHPVEIRWSPPPRSARLDGHAAAVVMHALDVEVGDVLVFLPGMGEIERVGRLLAEAGVPAEVHRLHGSLAATEQDAALAPSIRRKVVLSTDIAETSLTVEGVRVVVDGGLARAPRFDPRTGMTRLMTVNVSRASADQRAGRAGRTEPGVCYRLWSRLEHGTRRPHIDPEITQVDLTGLALELRSWGTPDPAALSFLDPPPRRTLDEAETLLARLGAIDREGALTPVGRAMAELPVHPRLGHMILGAGSELACILAALLSERDPLRGRPDQLPVDVGLRVALVTGDTTHPELDRRALERVRRVAADLARRAGLAPGSAASDETGPTLALAYPDRLAVRRGSPGRFQMRTGTTAFMSPHDPLATETFLVVADLDGKRKDARIRLAAPVEAATVAALFGEDIDTHETVVWSGDRLMRRRERRLGGITLDVAEFRPEPTTETTSMVLARAGAGGGLPWTDQARRVYHRVAFLRSHRGEPWPDWGDPSTPVREYLASTGSHLTGLDDLERLDLERALFAALDPGRRSELDREAPERLRLSNGKTVTIEYGSGAPVVAIRVQEVLGVVDAHQVAGVPVTFQLLSPAGRPLQITSDLAGFWEGSWQVVRKEMAGRYPKHAWPENPGRR